MNLYTDVSISVMGSIIAKSVSIIGSIDLEAGGVPQSVLDTLVIGASQLYI